MQAKLTPEMLTALRETAEIPDTLASAAQAAVEDGDGFLINLTEDDAIAMVEMCQWYIKKDPVTGELTPKAQLFSNMVDAIDDANMV